MANLIKVGSWVRTTSGLAFASGAYYGKVCGVRKVVSPVKMTLALVHIGNGKLIEVPVSALIAER